MKEFKNEKELTEYIERENYYYKGQKFESYAEMVEVANKFFKSVTEDFEDKEEYYKMFGLEVGDCHKDVVKKETYYIDEYNNTWTVHFVECYIDSGVPAEDYFYGYYITE